MVIACLCACIFVTRPTKYVVNGSLLVFVVPILPGRWSWLLLVCVHVFLSLVPPSTWSMGPCCWFL